MGLKQGAIGNLKGTCWELIGNLKGTCWEQRKTREILKATLDKGPRSNKMEHSYWLRAINLDLRPLDEDFTTN